MNSDKSTKVKILEASMKLFGEKGFHGTSFQNIADAVGITQPGIFIHFKNKMILFEALRVWVAESNRTYVDSNITIYDDALEALQKHIYLNIEWALKNPHHFQIILLLYYFSCSDKKMMQLNKAALESGEKRLLKYLLAAEREGKIQKNRSNVLVKQLHSFTIGYAIKTFNSNEPADYKTIAKIIKDEIQRK